MNFGMMRLVAVVHSMVRNMAPFGGTCVVYLHPYIPNNGKSEQGRCYRISVPKFLPFQNSWPLQYVSTCTGVPYCCVCCVNMC